MIYSVNPDVYTQFREYFPSGTPKTKYIKNQYPCWNMINNHHELPDIFSPSNLLMTLLVVNFVWVTASIYIWVSSSLKYPISINNGFAISIKIYTTFPTTWKVKIKSFKNKEVLVRRSERTGKLSLGPLPGFS